MFGSKAFFCNLAIWAHAENGATISRQSQGVTGSAMAPLGERSSYFSWSAFFLLHLFCPFFFPLCH